MLVKTKLKLPQLIMIPALPVPAASTVFFRVGMRKSMEGLMTYDRTNRSRLGQLELFGLKVMNLLKRTCATGAMPMGAPG